MFVPMALEQASRFVLVVRGFCNPRASTESFCFLRSEHTADLKYLAEVLTLFEMSSLSGYEFSGLDGHDPVRRKGFLRQAVGTGYLLANNMLWGDDPPYALSSTER
jgi:hypothetical protein